MKSPKFQPKLIGESTETDTLIFQIKAKALIDTGSTVSTISKSFYDDYLQANPINPLDDFVNIECADGNSLSYLGYIETEIQPIGIPNCTHIPCLFLIVPDSNYTKTVPILLGTNVINLFLNKTQYQYGEKFLQETALQTPWFLAFRSLQLREKALIKQNFRLAIVKSAEHQTITISPNSQVVINGFADRKIPYHTTCALLQSTKYSRIPTDLDIEPSVVKFDFKENEVIPVTISNLTTRTVTINPKAVVCELHPVSIIHQSQQLQHDLVSHLQEINISKDNMTSSQMSEIQNLLETYQDIFSKRETDIGFNNTIKHRIELLDEEPFKQRTRRIPPAMFEEIRNHLQMLLDSKVIRKSCSPFSSNIVLVKKKDNKLRMCIDYRQLNQRTKKDAYALPRIEEILNALSGKKYFSVLDMKSGYHQVEILEEHKERTAFTVGPLGFYEFNRLPFGLSNSPATYQRLMENCLGDLHLNICFIFLDDLIIFSKTYEEHLDRLQLVFEKLRESGLKLSPKKCNLFMQKVKYVGHIVSEEGIETDPEKVQKVLNWPTPHTPEEIRKFIGFIGYYRKFIPNFSKISKPLTEMMPKTNNSKDKKHKQAKKEFKWGKEQMDAFQHLKELLTSPPILGFADYDLPFELHTDASKLGLGAVLYQEQQGQKKVISYASRSLNPAEKNYPAHKLEFLALKWAITEKFNDYLYGHKFTVLTDNNPLTYVLTTARLDAAGHRWFTASTLCL